MNTFLDKPLLKRLLLVSLIGLMVPSYAYNRESAIGVSVLSLLVWNPMQLDGVGFDYSRDVDFERNRMLWLWDFEQPLYQIGHLSLNGHLEVAFGQTSPAPPNVSFGLTPVLEWTLQHNEWQTFIESGLGANYVSKTTHEDRQLSTHFQFGEILGVGARYKSFQAGLRFQHLSNGDIAVPNNGYNFYGVVFKFWY